MYIEVCLSFNLDLNTSNATVYFQSSSHHSSIFHHNLNNFGKLDYKNLIKFVICYNKPDYMQAPWGT